MSDALATLADLPGVADAAEAARSEIDALLWDRAVRARAAEVVAESALVGARDSAALEGAELDLAVVRAGLDASPIGRAVAASVDVTSEIPTLVDVWQVAPLQVLARLHVVAARGFTDPADLGRPRIDDVVVDPLHLGAVPPAAGIPERLAGLADVLTRPTTAPAIVVAAVAHAEVLAMRPFHWGSGLIARACVRLVLAGRGVDPDLLGRPEAGMLSQGRRTYVEALRAYASGEPGGVAQWLVWNATAIGYGAHLART